MSQVILNLDQCVHCQDCVLICPVGVWGFANRKVFVAHEHFCMGPECNQCSDSCWKEAILITHGADGVAPPQPVGAATGESR